MRQEQFATKGDIQNTKLWFVISAVGGIMALLSFAGTIALIVLRLIS